MIELKFRRHIRGDIRGPYKTIEEVDKALEAGRKLEAARQELRKTLSAKEEPLVTEADLKAAAQRFVKMNASRSSPKLRAARARLKATLSGKPVEPEPIKEDSVPDWLQELEKAQRQSKLAEARRRLRKTLATPLNQKQLDQERL